MHGVEVGFQLNEERTSVMMKAVQLPDDIVDMLEVIDWPHKFADVLKDLKCQISVVLDGICLFMLVFKLLGTNGVEPLKMFRLVLYNFSGRF